MTGYPTLKPKQVIKALLAAGFYIDHQKGSHVRLINKVYPDRKVTLPFHNKDIPRGTLSNILRQSGLSFRELLGYL